MSRMLNSQANGFCVVSIDNSSGGDIDLLACKFFVFWQSSVYRRGNCNDTVIRDWHQANGKQNTKKPKEDRERHVK